MKQLAFSSVRASANVVTFGIYEAPQTLRSVRCKLFLFAFFGAASVAALGQSSAPVTNLSDGNLYSLPKYSGSTTLTNSAITEVNGNVGIGVTSADNRIQVQGLIDFGANGNTALGQGTLANGNTGYFNTGAGYAALTANSSGSYNAAFGGDAMSANTSGHHNAAFGFQALVFNNTGSNNAGFGSQTLTLNTSGSNNVAVGFISLYSNTTGHDNVGVGANSLSGNSTGIANTAVGIGTLNSNTTGNNNTAIGLYSLFGNINGSNNIGIGQQAIQSLTSGSGNIGIGWAAGIVAGDGVTPNQTSINSVYLGNGASGLADGDVDEVVIGDSAVGAGSNTVTIGSPTTTTTVLNGSVKLTSASGITFADGTSMSTVYVPPTNFSGGSNGNIGIGTTSPASLLSVNGGASIGAAYTGIVAPTNGAAIQGYVGIGTYSPVSDLTLGNPSGDPNPNSTGAQRYYANGGLTFQSSGGITVGRVAAVQENGFYVDRSDLALSVGQGGNNELEVMRLQAPTGNVGIGTTTPGAKLEVDGNVKLTSGSGASITFADGTVQTTAYVGTTCPIAELVMPDKTIIAQGGDYAESVDVNGDRASYEPGDVMVIDPINPEHFLKSSKPYSTLVAGIYSTKPGYVGRRQPGDPKMAKTEIPMAMIGIVPTKVTTENGPINVGDLLVTSSHEGYAMKGTDRGALNGAIVGKALTKLDSGNGVIEVLVSLQ